MNQQTGKYLLIAAACIAVAGIIIYFFHDKMNWIGRLPGDVRIERNNFKFYFPFTTMILLSLLLTFIITGVRKLFS
jgi:hypothetical protein